VPECNPGGAPHSFIRTGPWRLPYRCPTRIKGSRSCGRQVLWPWKGPGAWSQRRVVACLPESWSSAEEMTERSARAALGVRRRCRASRVSGSSARPTAPAVWKQYARTRPTVPRPHGAVRQLRAGVGAGCARRGRRRRHGHLRGRAEPALSAWQSGRFSPIRGLAVCQSTRPGRRPRLTYPSHRAMGIVSTVSKRYCSHPISASAERAGTWPHN
jgi:hypothetical protein